MIDKEHRGYDLPVFDVPLNGHSVRVNVAGKLDKRVVGARQLDAAGEAERLPGRRQLSRERDAVVLVRIVCPGRELAVLENSVRPAPRDLDPRDIEVGNEAFDDYALCGLVKDAKEVHVSAE